jgi:hypothetical protein
MTPKPPACPECEDTGMVWSDGCNCGVGPHGYYGMHERHCGAEPCPNGCPVKPRDTAREIGAQRATELFTASGDPNFLGI